MVSQIKDLIDKFGTHTRAKGEAYFQQGRVRNTFILCGKLHASVIGSNQYYLNVDLKSGDSACSCPMESGCKHVAAALLYADENPPQDYSQQFEKLELEAAKDLLLKMVEKHLESAPLMLGLMERKASSKANAQSVFKSLIPFWGDGEYADQYLKEDIAKLKGNNKELLALFYKLVEYDKKHSAEEASEKWHEEKMDEGDFGPGEWEYYDDLMVELSGYLDPIMDSLDVAGLDEATLEKLAKGEQDIGFSLKRVLLESKRSEPVIRSHFGETLLFSYLLRHGRPKEALSLLATSNARARPARTGIRSIHFSPLGSLDGEIWPDAEELAKLYAFDRQKLLEAVKSEAIAEFCLLALKNEDIALFEKAFARLVGERVSCPQELIRHALARAGVSGSTKTECARRYVHGLDFVASKDKYEDYFGGYALDLKLLESCLALYPQGAEFLLKHLEGLVQSDSQQRGAVNYVRTVGLVRTLKKCGFSDEARRAREYLQERHFKRHNLRKAMGEAGMGW
ncbi:MAG: SWIM zinc finger family protein [Candidatus Micrarchaeota archaeon]